MGFPRHRNIPFAAPFFALMLLLASCGKNELVTPCGHDQPETTATAKNSGGDGGGKDATNDPPPPDGGWQIGDDGDDLSGTERNRRRRPD